MNRSKPTQPQKPAASAAPTGALGLSLHGLAAAPSLQHGTADQERAHREQAQRMHEQGQFPQALKRADASAASQPPNARPEDKGKCVDTSRRAPPPPPPTVTRGMRPPPVKVPQASAAAAASIDARYVIASSELSTHSGKAASSTTGSAPRTPSASSSTPKKKRDISFTPVRSTITPVTTPDPSPALQLASIPPSPPCPLPSFDPFASTPSRYHGSSKAVAPAVARSHGKPMSEKERAGWDRLHMKTVAITEMLRNRRPYTRADAQASNAEKDRLRAAAMVEAAGVHGPVASGASSVTTTTTTTTTTTVKTQTTITTTTTRVQAQSTKSITAAGAKAPQKLEGGSSTPRAVVVAQDQARSAERPVSSASSVSSTRATVSEVLPLDDVPARRPKTGSKLAQEVGVETPRVKSSQPAKTSARAASPKRDTRREVKAVPVAAIAPAPTSPPASAPRPQKQSTPSVASTRAPSASRPKPATASTAAKSAEPSSNTRAQIAAAKKPGESSKGKDVVSGAPSLLRSVSSPTSKVHSSASNAPSISIARDTTKVKTDACPPVACASYAQDGMPIKTKARSEIPAVPALLASSSRPVATPSAGTSSRSPVSPASATVPPPPVAPSPPISSPLPAVPSPPTVPLRPPVLSRPTAPPRSAPPPPPAARPPTSVPPSSTTSKSKQAVASQTDAKPPATQKPTKAATPKPSVSKPSEEPKQMASFLTRKVNPSKASVAPTPEATSRAEVARPGSPASARSHRGRTSSAASIDSHRSKADGGKMAIPPPSPKAGRYREGISMTPTHASTAHSELSTTRTMSTKDPQRTPRGSPALAQPQPLPPSPSSHRSGTILSRSQVSSVTPSTPVISTYSASIASSYTGSHASSSRTISSASLNSRKEGTRAQASVTGSSAPTRSTSKASSLSVSHETPKRDTHPTAKTVAPKATPRLSDVEIKAARRATPMPGTIPSPSTSLLEVKRKAGPSTPAGPSTAALPRSPAVPPPITAAKAGKSSILLTSSRSSTADSVSTSSIPPVKEVARHQARVSKADTVFSNVASIYEVPPPLPRTQSVRSGPAEKAVTYTGKERASDLTPTRSSFASLDFGVEQPVQVAATSLRSSTTSYSTPGTTPASEDALSAHSPFSYKLTGAFEDYSDEEDDEVYLSQPDPLAFLRLEKPLPRSPTRTSTLLSAESLAKLDEAIDRLQAFAPKRPSSHKATKSAMKPRVSVASCTLGEPYAVILPRHLEGIDENVPGPSKAPSTSANHVRFVNFPNRSESTIDTKADSESPTFSLSERTRMSRGVEVPVEQPPRYSDLSPLVQGNFAGSSTTLPLRTGTRLRSQSDATAYGSSALRHTKSTPFLYRSSSKLRQLKENRYPPIFFRNGDGAQSTTSFGTVDSRPSPNVRWLSKEEPANLSAVSKVLRKGKNVLGLGKKANRDQPAPPMPTLPPAPPPAFRPRPIMSGWPPDKPIVSPWLKR